jgi:hypothetical protein
MPIIKNKLNDRIKIDTESGKSIGLLAEGAEGSGIKKKIVKPNITPITEKPFGKSKKKD